MAHQVNKLVESSLIGVADGTFQIWRSVESNSKTPVFYVLKQSQSHAMLFKGYGHYLNFKEQEIHERLELTRTEYEHLENISIDNLKTEMYAE